MIFSENLLNTFVLFRVNEDVYTIPTINMQMEAIGIRQVEQKMYNSFDNE